MKKQEIINKIHHYEKDYSLPSGLLEAVVFVESSFNKNALGALNEIGLTQLLPSGGALEEYETRFGPVADPWNVDTNLKVAAWYLGERIPELLRHYGHKVSIANRIRAYNAGIGNLNKGKFPLSTKLYIAKVNAYRGAALVYAGLFASLLAGVAYYSQD